MINVLLSIKHISFFSSDNPPPAVIVKMIRSKHLAIQMCRTCKCEASRFK